VGLPARLLDARAVALSSGIGENFGEKREYSALIDREASIPGKSQISCDFPGIEQFQKGRR
jgi:hypothetical protein